MESIFLRNLTGFGAIDALPVIGGLLLLIILLFIFLLRQGGKIKRMSRRLENLTRGKDGKSLEHEIDELFDDNKYIAENNDSNRKAIREISARLGKVYQKLGLVHYDAYNQMGGKLSFCIALLNEKDDGFLMNSVHSADGSHVYTKAIHAGQSDLDLAPEERAALRHAMGD